MAREMETSTVVSSLDSMRGESPKGGWKVREWKSRPSIMLKPSKNEQNREVMLRGAFRRTNIESTWIPTQQSPRRRQTVRPAERHEGVPRYRLWKRIALGLSACASAVIIGLIMSSSLQQQDGLWNAAGMAKAEAHPANEAQPASEVSPTNEARSAEAHPANGARQTIPNESYRIQLGSYSKETDARYAWAVLRVEFGELLEGLKPRFDNVQNGDRSFYQILAGTVPKLNDADRLCTHLEENGIPCVIVEQQMTRISSR